MTDEEMAEARQRIGQHLHSLGIIDTPELTDPYAVTDYSRWHYVREPTTHGGAEIVTPILTGTPQEWATLAAVLQAIRDNGGIPTTTTGGHINVGTGPWRRFIRRYV